MAAQLSMFKQRIERVESVVDGQTLKLPGTLEHCYAATHDGRRWFRKRELDTGPESVVAEAVSLVIADELGCPMPRAAVVGAGTDDVSWLSALVSPVVHWSPPLWDIVANPEDLGAVITLDAITHNDDRHAGNILFETLPDRTLRLWAIDSGRALAGRPRELKASALTVPARTSRAPVYQGERAHEARASALRAAKRAGEISPMLLREAAHEACSLVRDPDADTLAVALIERCRHAEMLTLRFLEDIDGVP